MAVEGQLVGVATLVVRLLAFAVPIRGHHVELRGCGSPTDQHDCMISVNWVCYLAANDDRF
jgi:hypothetical protein